jgi:hypothetical protein
MSVLININGTAIVSIVSIVSVYPCWTKIALLQATWGWSNGGVDVHLISVRTEETRLINRAFTLASSRGPLKPGSADAVQPTMA